MLPNVIFGFVAEVPSKFFHPVEFVINTFMEVKLCNCVEPREISTVYLVFVSS